MAWRRSNFSRAFTLAELLVVIGVIAILIGMLMPALTMARRQAGRVSCVSNLHQWAIAVNQYAVDQHNFLPRRGQGQQPTAVINRSDDWFNALPMELKMTQFQDLITQHTMPTPQNNSLWICPQALMTPNSSGYLFTYAMNMRLSTWVTALPDRIDNVGQTSTMVFMTDGPGGYCSVLPFNGPFSCVARHNGQINISFLDGHVASFNAAYIGCGVGDPQHTDVRWVVPNSPWAGPS